MKMINMVDVWAILVWRDNKAQCVAACIDEMMAVEIKVMLKSMCGRVEIEKVKLLGDPLDLLG
jgi:hypothetical protein